MAQPIVINKFGTMQGWNAITVNLFGRDVEGITALKYLDSQEKENVYGSGSKPVGRSRGNYEAEASITLYKEEVDAIKSASDVPLLEIAPFDIIVQYTLPDGAIKKDIIRNAEFTNDGVEVEQGDGSITTEHELIISHIEYDAA
ncbi:MAG TPA: hypothetical protein DHV22_08045 [Xanthomarina gelatinilytica]|uniref:Phage tail protein n=1 Tax=Xanthomarina gelatinilytica TaxID=1137281 RepID=A0A3D6BTG1_9FLAO|nr:hypothetical protein [Xanthomarina gelatinilytica]